MGRYFYLVNDTLRQRLDPQQFGEGAKLGEFVPGNGRTWAVLAVLLAPPMNVSQDLALAQDRALCEIAGTWRGGAIRIVGTDDPTYQEVSDQYEDISQRCALGVLGRTPAPGSASHLCSECHKVTGMSAVGAAGYECWTCGHVSGAPKSKPRVERYTFQTRWSEEEDEWVATCLEFPSLSYLHQDKQQAEQGARRLVAEAVADMFANGEPIPAPGRVEGHWAPTDEEIKCMMIQEPARVPADEIHILSADKRTSLVLQGDGTIRVNGRVVATDTEVVEGMRKALSIAPYPWREQRMDLVVDGALLLRLFSEGGAIRFQVRGRPAESAVQVVEALDTWVRRGSLPFDGPPSDRFSMLMQVIEPLWHEKQDHPEPAESE